MKSYVDGSSAQLSRLFFDFSLSLTVLLTTLLVAGVHFLYGISVQTHMFHFALVAKFLVDTVFAGLLPSVVIALAVVSAGPAMMASCITYSRRQLDGYAFIVRYLVF